MMTPAESMASLELTKQVARSVRELRKKVDHMDEKVDQLSTNLLSHRLTGNGEGLADSRKRLPFGLNVKDLLLFVLLAEVVGSNVLDLLGVR